MRWNLDSTSARRWKEKGVGTFPIHFGYQIQLTEGLSFLPKDPTWAPSVRLSCWRRDEQTPSLTFIVFDLNFRSFSAAVCGLRGLEDHSKPLSIDASGLTNGPRLLLSSCHLSDRTLRQQLLVCSENHVDFGFGVHHLAYFRKSSGGKGEMEKIWEVTRVANKSLITRSKSGLAIWRGKDTLHFYWSMSEIFYH